MIAEVLEIFVEAALLGGLPKTPARGFGLARLTWARVSRETKRPDECRRCWRRTIPELFALCAVCRHRARGR